MTADADSPSWRQLQRRRQADRDFLARLHYATRAELRLLAVMPMPAWRRVAVERALGRVKK